MKAFKMMFLAAMVAALTAPAIAGNIFLDENFEDGTPFTNLNYPVRDETTTPTLANIAATQGACVRANDNAAAAAPLFALTNSGTISAAAAYAGTQGLQLASGQSVAVDSSAGVYHNANLNNHMFMQFALAFPDSVFSLPAGTQVGHYTQNWDTDNQATPATEVTYQLNFVRNNSGGVDIVVQNSGSGAKRVLAANQWSVISIDAQKASDAAYSNGYTWIAWDPFAQVFKGPQPVAGDPIAGTASTADLARVPCGISLHVGSNTAASYVSNTDLGSNWGTEGNKDNTRLISWQLVAENGGTLLVDEMYYSGGYLQGVTDPQPGQPNQITQDMSARMLDFVGPIYPPPASAKDWSLLE